MRFCILIAGCARTAQHTHQRQPDLIGVGRVDVSLIMKNLHSLQEVHMKACEFRRTFTMAITVMMLVTYMVVPLSAFGQTANTGSITGVVKDQSGGVVSGAAVRAINKSNGFERKTTTSDSGSYELSQLPPGEYRVEAESQGFTKFIAEPVTVNVLGRVTIDPDHKPSGAVEQVTVTGESAPLI